MKTENQTKELVINDEFKEIGQPLTKYIKGVSEEDAEFQKNLFFNADVDYKYQKDARIAGIVGNRQFVEPHTTNVQWATELLRQIFSFGGSCRVYRYGSGKYHVYVHALYNFNKVIKSLNKVGMELCSAHVESNERKFEYGWSFQRDTNKKDGDDVGKLVPVFQTVRYDVLVRSFPKFKKAFAKYEEDYKEGSKSSKIFYPKKDYPNYVYDGVGDLVRHLPKDQEDLDHEKWLKENDFQ